MGETMTFHSYYLRSYTLMSLTYITVFDSTAMVHQKNYSSPKNTRQWLLYIATVANFESLC